MNDDVGSCFGFVASSSSRNHDTVHHSRNHFLILMLNIFIFSHSAQFTWKANISWVTVRGGGHYWWGVGGRLRGKTGRCPVDAVHERRLRSRPLWFRRTLDLIHVSSDSGWFVTSVVKLLDITLLGHTVIDLKVDFNMFADETVGVALKL